MNTALMTLHICEPIASPTQQVITQRPAMWKTSENLCMLSAMFSLMNEEQKNLVTVGSDHIDILTAGVDFNNFVIKL